MLRHQICDNLSQRQWLTNSALIPRRSSEFAGLTCTYTQPCSHMHTHTWPRSHVHTLSLTHACAHTRRLVHTCTHSSSLTRAHAHLASLTRAHTLGLVHACAHTLSLAHARTHTCVLQDKPSFQRPRGYLHLYTHVCLGFRIERVNSPSTSSFLLKVSESITPCCAE